MNTPAKDSPNFTSKKKINKQANYLMKKLLTNITFCSLPHRHQILCVFQKNYEYFKVERLSASIYCPSYNIKRYRSHKDCGAIASYIISVESLIASKKNKSFVTTVNIKD